MENKQDSSDEESGFNSFASRLKDKWLSGTSTEEMNLKKSSEIDFKKKEGEEKFPKVIVTKLKLGKSDEVSVKTEEKTGKRASSAKKQTKSESRGRALSSEDEEGDSKEIEKLKVDKTKIKSETKDKKVNTLSSSDDESQSQGVEVRNVVHKNKREKKEDAGNKNTRKSEQTKEDGKHIIENASRSSNKKEDKLKCDSSDKDNKANKHRTGYKDNVEKKEKTQVKNLSSDDEDKDKRNTRKTGPTKEKEGKVTESTRSRSSEKKKKENEIKCDIKGEDSKANKQKDIPENKSKKLSKQEDESDDDTSKANDRRSKSRDTRKGKIKENSDDEVTNNKKQKLKESNQSKDTKNTDSKENSEEEETKENEGKGTENTRSRSSVKKEKEHKMEYDKSGEDSKANKQKYVSENKSKKRIKNEDESDDDINRPSTTDDHKSKSKDTRKSKMEANSDNEVTKNKKQKLKEFKESKDTKKVFDSKENCEEETANNTSMETKKSNKSKNSNEIEEDKQDSSSKKAKTINEKRKVLLDSSDEEQMDSVVENGETISVDVDGEKTTTERQRNAELIEIDSDEKDYTLELQASSTENTNNIEMVEEKENNFEGKEGENILEKPEIDSSCKEKVETKEITKTKFVGFDSSSDEEVQPKVISKKIARNRSVRNQRKSQTKLVLSSDDEDEETKVEGPVHIESSDDNEEKGGKEKDVDFSVTLGISSESSDSDILPNNKRKKTKSSDSDVSISSSESKKKKKRRRIKLADSSDESGGSGDEKSKGQKNNDGESPAKGGRKNIKKIKKKGDLEQTTITAAEEEKERRKRIEERQKLFNQVFEIKESAKLEKLVLDFDPETKKELISVNKDLVAKMKPHQAKGVKFMWDSCFESVKQIKKTKGSGCILAHCMGLGKTFQVVSLVHTLLTHEELTKVRTVMVVCPLSTVLNWVNEFAKWLEDIEGGDDIEVFHLTKYIKNPDRARELRRWQHNGGVLIMGYEMFRNLTNETTKKFKAKMKKDFLETLIDPGADLIVCDEGHMLKNEATALSKAMTRVRTLRRIVLTGTPMQNNLKEYHCMVQFVKPNLLGTSKEFLNRFVNPINNGQFVDSTDHDVKLMKRRAHVLHKMLEGLVQRFDYNVLTPFLPPKQEYVISVCLSELQEKLYSHYLENESQKAEGMKGGTRLFMDWQTLGRVWTHPRVLKMSTDKANWLKEKKAMEASDSEGSLRDFIDDDSDKSTTSPESSSEDDSSSDGGKKKKKPVHKSRSTRATRQSSSVALLESSDEEKRANEAEDALEDTPNKGEWWCSFVEPQHFEDMRQSGKLLLLFAILKECELIEDKVLVFSQSLFSLDLIEYFLDKIDAATQEGRLDENLDNHQGTWSKGLDYFRLDGSTSSENRNIWCKAFNREDNPRARLFLISTRAGGLGINLTAANRVIIFDASWNPSHDIQSIFRIYRFGQKKPCYVYRFVAYGTMEEKVYERQVAKQSISNRVVDEQQVHRHFSMNDLTELYTFTPASKLDERPTPTLPRDPLMAEILSQMKQWIEKYHEHDSLLENVVEEELNEEERKAAWEDYENDKKRGFMPPAGPQGPAMNPNAAWNQQIEIMRQQLKLRYGDKSDDEINQILVYQVSIMMRQQQQQQMQMAAAAQMQAAGNMGYRPQMYGNNAMFNQRPQMQTTAYLRNIAPKPASQQNYTPDQVYRMQQQANLARLQLQQMAAQQKSQSQPRPTTLQTLLQGAAASKYPTANIPALQRMKQNYQAPSQDKPGVTITEILDDKPSGSSES